MSNVKFSTSHEWIKPNNENFKIGITDYAQDELGDIVFVELPSAGDTLTKESPFGVIESVKAVSDLIAPISGKIVAINEALISNPELLNTSPQDEGWIIEVEPTNNTELDELMSEEDYNKFVESEK